MNLVRLQERLRKKELTTAEAATAMRVQSLANARRAMNILQALGFVVSEEKEDWRFARSMQLSGKVDRKLAIRTYWRFKDWTYPVIRYPYPNGPDAGRKASRLAELDAKALRTLVLF